MDEPAQPPTGPATETAGTSTPADGPPTATAARPRRERGGERLRGRVAIVTAAATGIGRAVAIGFAREGAHVAIAWFDERGEAAEVVERIEAEGVRALSVPGDLGNPDYCQHLVEQTIHAFGRVDILANAAAPPRTADAFEDGDPTRLEALFRASVFGPLQLTRCVLPHLTAGSAIVNATSAAAYRGAADAVEHAAADGAVVAFTRSLALALAGRGIRVNAVAVADAPGVAPVGRPDDPEQVAPSYIFLASDEATCMTGQVLHPNGGIVVNG